jgi:hypothetical protein
MVFVDYLFNWIPLYRRWRGGTWKYVPGFVAEDLQGHFIVCERWGAGERMTDQPEPDFDDDYDDCEEDPRCPECNCSLHTDEHEWDCSYTDDEDDL